VNAPGRVFAAAVLAALSGGAAAMRGSAPDPFAFLAPAIHITAAQRVELDTGEVIVRSLPVDDGHLGVFAAARLDAPPAALIAWTNEIESLKRGRHVTAVGRFSDPPVEADLDRLALDSGDLDALEDCRPASCGVKLAASEIDRIRSAIRAAGAGWRDAAAQAFRQVLIARVAVHRTRGLTALPPYADRARPASLYEAFAAIVTRSPYLATGLPELAAALETPSLAAIPGSQSLYYWSQERYGAGKPVVTVTHVRYWMPEATLGGPAAVAASAQIFASHYTNAALGLTMVLCEPDGAACYLAYVNRSHADLFGGLLGGLKRSIARQRIESQTPALLRTLRDRLHSAPPAS
jgi:hypothetical protein